ncbi:MAG: hypothetical protein ABGY43_14330 [bacterium]|nr:hypothetical protein [Gammaproteobacteria bacterium]HIL85141.1 hypothetical protein [Pseudomonadales bacterium]
MDNSFAFSGRYLVDTFVAQFAPVKAALSNMGAPLFGYFPANQAFWWGHSQSQSGGHYRGIVESSHLPEIAHHSWRLLAFPRIGPISDRNWYTSTRRTAEGPVIPIVVLVIDGETGAAIGRYNCNLHRQAP